jgi:CheY-like chemotaxis protein
VETAADGAEALERLRLEVFDAVLMDLHMPVMDGVEAVARIRDGQAGRRDIPVIALTGDGMVGEENRLKALGFDALEPKPIQPATLLATITRVLDSHDEGVAAESVA